MTLDARIEAVLFATAQAMTVKRLSELLQAETAEIKEALDVLAERLEASGSGVQLLAHGSEAELVTRPEAAELVRAAIKAEATGELTRPSLEALAILAYRGPMTRPELEQIRGVQSALILRNLMMRGLAEMKEDVRLGQPTYAVTSDFLKHLGVDRIDALPDFDALHGHPVVEQVLKELETPEPSADQTLAV